MLCTRITLLQSWWEIRLVAGFVLNQGCILSPFYIDYCDELCTKTKSTAKAMGDHGEVKLLELYYTDDLRTWMKMVAKWINF